MRPFSRIFIGISGVLALLTGCGSNTGVLTPLTDSGNEQSIDFGGLTTRMSGTAQPPVTSAGSGATVTGVAGGTIASMTLTQPGFDQNSTKIAFQSDRDVANVYQIYTMNADGSNLQRLTNTGRNSVPSWSPNGAKIAYESITAVDNQPEIYSMNSDGTGQTRLTINAGVDTKPRWSPDGSKIVFISDREGNYRIFSMNADGTGVIRLTNNGGDNDNPIWSPDGSKIAFVSNFQGNYEVYLMNSDGSNQTRMTNNGAQDIHPAWSPDGSKIAFASNRDGNYEVYSMFSDGTGQTRLTNNAASDFLPFWSPDGTKLLFESRRDGNPELYVMNPDGSNQTRLTNHPNTDTNPSWSWATTKRLPLVGTNGTLASSAAGFLYGRNGGAITSLLVFDTPAATRSTARIATTTGIASGLSNYAFTITHPDNITALAYTNDVYGRPSVVIGSGGLSPATGVMVDYNAPDGRVIAVLPYSASRSAAPSAVKAEGNMRVYRGHFLGVWNSDGKNVAPGGASEVRIDRQTGGIRTLP